MDDLTDKLQEDYEKLIGEESDKKQFIRSLTWGFALLFDTKVDTVDKKKNYVKLLLKQHLKYGKDKSNTKTYAKYKQHPSVVDEQVPEKTKNQTI